MSLKVHLTSFTRTTDARKVIHRGLAGGSQVLLFEF